MFYILLSLFCASKVRATACFESESNGQNVPSAIPAAADGKAILCLPSHFWQSCEEFMKEAIVQMVPAFSQSNWSPAHCLSGDFIFDADRIRIGWTV